MGLPIIGDLINGVKDLISEAVVDKDKKLQLDLELAKLEDQAQARLDAQVNAQIEVNKVEASSGSVFVAGWRPAVGWIGAASLAYSAILYPFLMWASRIFGYTGVLPEIDDSTVMTILLGMLGIGGMRTLEKVKGVSTNDYRDVPKAPTSKEEPAVAAPPKKKFKL